MKNTRMYKRKVDNKLRWYGETDVDKKMIKVNKKKSKKAGSGELIDTIVHEETHATHPKMHERTVQKVTKALLPTLSQKRKQAYYRRYA